MVKVVEVAEGSQKRERLRTIGDEQTDTLWPLFWQLCEYRAIVPLKYRRREPLGPWEDIPGRPADFKAPEGKKQRDPEIGT